MKRVEHIGIAVKDLEKSNQLFARLLGKPHYKIEVVESEGVRTSFFDVGGVKIELLAATSNDSPIARFIEKRGEGVHHIAFEVDELDRTLANKVNEGFESINKVSKAGADNKMIAFLHPKSANGVLVELCEDQVNKG